MRFDRHAKREIHPPLLSLTDEDMDRMAKTAKNIRRERIERERIERESKQNGKSSRIQ